MRRAREAGGGGALRNVSEPPPRMRGKLAETVNYIDIRLDKAS
jgi:hypothetical protein